MLYGMRDLLEVVDLGYELTILTAGNGLEALTLLNTEIPDIIVSDIMMPLMDGFQLLNQLQKRAELANVPFIFLTARGEKHEIHQGRLSKATLYITKPFQSVELLELIKTQLDRKLELERLREHHINNLKKGVLQILNHEFRTPLTYVTAYYEMLADSVNTYADADNFQEYLRGIQAGCLRLTRLIESFIAVVELRSGEAQRKFEQQARVITDVDGLLREVVEGFQVRARRHDLRLVYHPSPDMPPIWGEPHSLRLIFQQLLDNAIKFSSKRFVRQPGTAVTVETAVRADELLISFRDEGIGLPPQMQSRIFDLFVQYNRDQLEQQGAGAGLTIANGLAQLHHGRIEVQSEENVGSTFSVVLPIYHELGAASLEQGQVGKTANVLIVEDEQYLLEGLRELLSIYNVPYALNIRTANNGRQGLERVAELIPDLIISDIMMPYMDGYTFLQEVRKNPDWVQIPFIFLTAKGERADVHRGLRSGAEEYVTKPYDSDELMGLIVKQLDRQYQMKQVMSRDFDDLERGIIELITPDFQVPLASVTRYSGELEHQISETRTDEELKESLQGIQSSSLRLSRLVEDFISLAEIKTGEAEMAYQLRAETISDVGYLLYEAGQLAGEFAAAKGIAVACALQVGLPAVYGDRVMLMDCLHRLLDVGLSFYKPYSDGVIELVAAPTVGEIYLTLRFPYPLSPLEARTVERNLTQEETGAATLAESPNLSIVQGYVGLHNGRLLLDQTTTHFAFRLVLPIAPLPHPAVKPLDNYSKTT